MSSGTRKEKEGSLSSTKKIIPVITMITPVIINIFAIAFALNIIVALLIRTKKNYLLYAVDADLDENSDKLLRLFSFPEASLLKTLFAKDRVHEHHK